ncbi:NAD(P)/FAD-dependent oxidoreductase [Pseudonocardia sp. C8]|uniref:flavin-containing monooxygenase n=1 Tax=Pseudonocardia sp. C8 TaxID=2762759 RepID=UPI001642A91A|nr:NAD(P)/FAD-dependent oxidoreductase [Pseudonocardia sp. C8]MBC3191793.1 NAD(P)/FAD-dependent oxidoreductase [Pseudonocardia sp. C8]
MEQTPTATPTPTVLDAVGDDDLRAALAEANLPTLQLVLAQLTGEEDWLDGEFRPTRTVALDDNDTAGLPAGSRARIVAAAFEVLRDVRDGRRPLPAAPSDAQLVALLSRSLGEDVPPEYGPSMAEEAGFRAREGLAWTAARPAAADRTHVLVIGAGAAGIATAVRLRALGIPFTVVEKNESVGGVWYENTYPGAGVDTPAHLYSFSFSPRREWSRYYAKQPEVLEYLADTAARFDLHRHIRFGIRVREARWDDAVGRWQVVLDGPRGARTELTTDAVVSCVGTLTEPVVPDLPGLEEFAGPAFHSARWDHSVDLTDKRVAVVGTGATAMQIVPAIADRARETVVFQRTPQWVVPNGNYLRDVPAGVRLLMEQVPYYAAFYRLRLVWQFQDKLLTTLRRDPEWPHPERAVNATNDRHRAFITRAMEEQLGEDADRLRDVVVPDYPPYSKRILMDNEWIRTLRRDDVLLVPERVTELDEKHVLTAGGDAHQVDVVVFATGFRSRRMLATLEITGRDGTTLRETWGDDDADAYLGITVPNFPNLFIVGGPQTTPAHGGSAIFVAECAANYAVQMIVRMIEDGIGAVEVRPEVAAEYSARVDAEHEQLVWTHPGTTNWYRNARGRVVNALPWRGVDYWRMTHHPDLADYLVRRADGSTSWTTASGS